MNNFRKFVYILIILTVVFPWSTAIAREATYSGYPTISISSVATDKTVTIIGYNFPANDNFTITMGSYGTLGIGGIVVGTTSTGSGGSFTKTYDIPNTLYGLYRIAIRMQSPTSGYYAYNWFYNDTSGSTAVETSGYVGYPTFMITEVVRDNTVTIKGFNFPANDQFKVTMGAYGTYGIGGIVVDTTHSGSGGTFVNTYTIPSSLAGSYRIAIRLQSSASGYFAYNWFYNNTTGTTGSGGALPPAGYTGYPTINISAVEKDKSVTINGSNFPANDKFIVTIGAYGTLGIGGIVVDTTDSGGGGSFTKTYAIPGSLAGSYRLAIRLQSPTSGYHAYNWFYNNSTP